MFSVDHSYGSSWGNYIQLSTGSMEAGSVASVVSPALSPINIQGDCFLFWYFLPGGGSLSVVLEEEGGRVSTLTKLEGLHGRAWRLHRVPLDPALPEYRLRLTGGPGNSSLQADLALDDLSVESEPCGRPLACSFEGGNLCSWSNSRAGGAAWLLTAGSTPSPDTGPSTDHTTGTAAGFYLYIEASSMISGQFATLASEPIMLETEECVSVWFHMFGSDIGRLEVVNVDIETGAETNVTTVVGDHGDLWQMLLLDSWPTHKLTSVQLRGSVTETAFYGDIAVDDVWVWDGRCQQNSSSSLGTTATTAPPASPADCDFEAGPCGWASEAGSGAWVASSGQTSDHTTGSTSGTFQQAHCNVGKCEAVLVLHSQLPGPGCLQWWYTLDSSVWNTLTLQWSDQPELLWRDGGARGPGWRRGRAELPGPAGRKIQFTAVKNRTGRVNLDDISWEAGACPEDGETCDMESGTRCGWHGAEPGQPAWQLATGLDHTTHTDRGHFLELGSEEEETLLISTVVAPVEKERCLQFYYVNTGCDEGWMEIAVYSRVVGGEIGDLQALHLLSACQQDRWALVLVTLPPATTQHEIVLAGRAHFVSVRVDDLALLGEGKTCSAGGANHNSCVSVQFF